MGDIKMVSYYGTDADNNVGGGGFTTYYMGDGNDACGMNAVGASAYMGNGDDWALAGNDFGTATGNGTLATPYDFRNATSSALTGANLIDGGAGVDVLAGFDGDDIIYGGTGNDSGVMLNSVSSLYFYAGLYGGVGNDYLDGGQGDDAMYGGAGNDTIYATSGRDTAFGGDGTDNIYGGRYILTTEGMTAEGNAGNDYIFAGDNIDVLYGDNAAGTETGNDFIWAGGGNDYLIGGNGTDTLIGNDGSDFFYGGAGADYFDLAYDVRGGDSDYLLDFQAGVDYVLMHKSNQNDVTFGVSGGYAYGFISEGSGSYLFLAAGLTAAQLQAATLFVI
jgi:Ca2+-binding RTX toxin-like protein